MGKKNCDTCYWKFGTKKYCAYYEKQPNEIPCNNHIETCKHCGDEYVQYEYKGGTYCENCILDSLGIKVEEETVYHYLDDNGDYIGNSTDGFEIEEQDGVNRID